MDESISNTVYENCLKVLLDQLQWRGTERQLKEALPHFNKITNETVFCNVLDNLKYDCEKLSISLDELDARIIPCLMVTDTNDIVVLIAKDNEKVTVYDGLTMRENEWFFSDLTAKSLKGVIYSFKLRKDEQPSGYQSGWLRRTFLENRGIIYSILFLSLMLSLFMLAMPIFIMAVYDRVIGVASYSMLSEFSVGIVVALAGIIVLHNIRSKQIAIVGARLDRAVGNNIFSRLLYLAPSYTETATVGAQVARIRDFDRLREFFSGPLMVICFEVPFIIISLVIIAILGGLLVVIPIVMMIVFVIVGSILRPRTKRNLSLASANSAKLQEFLLESINNMKVVKYNAVEEKWNSRYRELSADNSLYNLKISLYNSINYSISDVIMITAGMAILSFGAIKVMNGTLTIGAMIAIMILIWRVLAPLKTIFNTLPRILELNGSLRQITRLMKLTPESEPTDLPVNKKRNFRGDISFYRVSIRYPSAYVPSLVGVSFDVKAGTIVGVVGRNGSGKSTLLKMLLGLYQPQAGGIRIDNQDIRQINPIELRQSISYLPQAPELFYGTIAANLRLADPVASDEDLQQAAESAGVLEAIMALPDKFDTHIRDQSALSLAVSFQQQLCLARAYLRKGKLLLLDEPGNTLDFEADQHFMSQLDKLRGKTTTVLVTHRPSYLRKTDVILLLDQGQLIAQGSPDELLDKIPKDMI